MGRLAPVRQSATWATAGLVTCSIDVDAPREGRALTRVNWLLRQLKGAPESVRIEAFVLNARGAGATELLRHVREVPAALVADPKRDIRAFQIVMSATMGTKRGTGRGAFIDSVLNVIDAFYGDVVQHLKAWSAAPPKMREPIDVLIQPASLASTALSSQDGPEEPDGADGADG